MDETGWSALKKEWRNVTISAPDGREVAASRLLLQPPVLKIMAVPVINWMPEKHRLMLTFNSEYPEGRVVHFAMKMFSDDLGETWTEPEYLSETERLGMNSMTRYMENGVVLAYPQENQTERYIFRSEDYGATWKRFSQVRIPDGQNWLGSWDPPIFSDGKLFETGYIDQKRDGKAFVRAYYRVSEDGGRTFGADIFPEEWIGINEITLFRRKDGGFIGQGRYQNMDAELDQSDSLVVSVSDDGRNWSKPIHVRPWGRMHPSMVELSDRLIMTYVVRNGYEDSPESFPRFGIEAAESFDGGMTWSRESYALSQFTAEYLKGEERWAASTQSTSSLRLPDGNILTVFGTAHRATFGPGHRQMPRDIGIIRWKP